MRYGARKRSQPRAAYDVVDGKLVALAKPKRKRRVQRALRLITGRIETRWMGHWVGVPRATVWLPIHTVTECNAGEDYRSKYRRRTAQMEMTATALLGLGNAEWRVDVRHIRLTRLGPKHLDQGDNTASSSKHIRDQIAEWLAFSNVVPRRGQAKGKDGRSAGVHWEQDVRADADAYGVKVEFFLG